MHFKGEIANKQVPVHLKKTKKKTIKMNKH